MYLHTEKVEECAEYFREALRRDPRRPASQFGLARIYLRQEKYEQALVAADAADRLAPGSQNVHFVRGQILTRLGRKEEAQKEMAMAKHLMESTLNKDREALGEMHVPNPELAQPP
jgi:cytochrome c-type biogenesis protein CcmH/NrfG